MLTMSSLLFAEKLNEITGKITFKSNNYYYVSFTTTKFLNSGDTLYIMNKNLLYPAMTVQFLSKRSVACVPLINTLQIGDSIKAIAINNTLFENNRLDLIVNKNVYDNSIAELFVNKSEMKKNSIRGRIGITSYTGFNNFSTNNFSQRFRYHLSASEQNVSGSPINFSSYIIFTYKSDEWYKVNNNLGNALKVYDLNINYNFNGNSFYLGRRINPKISNIGTIDGIQYEFTIKNNTVGAIIGSRPNFSDFGFNLKLFQIGAFLERTDTLNNRTLTNTLSLFNQTNNFKTDRRFIYFQHANNVIENVNLFLSGEWDLYKIEKNIKRNNIYFTSFYSSINYNATRWASFSLSYDARKNVIYYETFRTYADSIYENELRQGFRFRTNLRLLNTMFIGLNYGYRFKNGDNKTNNNYSLNLNYYNLPIIKSSLNLTFNKVLSAYLNGTIYGAALGKDIFNGLINTNISYRYLVYNFTKYGGSLQQSILGIDLSFNLLRSFYTSFSYEGLFEQNKTYGNININFGKRF